MPGLGVGLGRASLRLLSAADIWTGGAAAGAFLGNLPASMTLINNHTMNAIPGTGWIQGARSGSIATVTDSTAPDDPTTVVQMTYPTTLAGGAEPWLLETNAFTASGYIRFYNCFRVRLSTNWYGHDASGINKVVHIGLGSGSANNRIIFAFFGAGSNALVPQFRLQNCVPIAADGGTRNYSPNVTGQTGTTYTRGDWALVEIEALCNTLSAGAANADGILRLWFNGTLITEVLNERFVGTGAPNWVNDANGRFFSYEQWAPTYGGNGGSTPPATQGMRMARLALYGRTT